MGAVPLGGGPRWFSHPASALPDPQLHSCATGTTLQWQVLDRRLPLYADHKTLLHKVATLFGAYF